MEISQNCIVIVLTGSICSDELFINSTNCITLQVSPMNNKNNTEKMKIIQFKNMIMLIKNM